MLHDLYLTQLIKAYLPPMAEMIMSEKPYPHSLVYTADLDGDGIREIIGAYNWQGNSYFLILKFYGHAWVVVANCLADSHIKHEPFLMDRKIQLYAATVKTARGNYWGFINENGVMVIPPQYEFAFDFQDNGLAIVQLKDHFGVIDQSGRYVVKPVYDSINQFSEGRAIVLDHHNFSVIDETGMILNPKPYEFIGDYHEGRALFHQIDDQEVSKYGYLDLQGKVVIPPQYQAANNFTEGKAFIKIKDSKYALIGLNGESLANFNYPYVGMPGDGLLAFQEKTNGKYGYIDEYGNVIISPRYTGAQPFRDGRAVVYISEDHRKKSGLIRKDGNYILSPEYNDILLLGETRAAIGKAIDEKKTFIGSKYAIADTNGNFLTDYRFYGVMDYVNGIASVYDDTHTFFIDRNGKTVQNLPKVRGGGALTLIGIVVQSNVDQRLSYFDRSGKVIWKQNTIIPLKPPYLVKEEKFKSNKDYFVYFPQVEGMANQAAQKKVNEKLRELSQFKNVPSNVELDYSYSGDFAVTFIQKDLLVLELNGYLYPHGHAHGMPNQIHAHINLINGNFYELKDMFKPNSNYVKVLSKIIGNQIQNDPQYSYVFPNNYEGIKANQPFYVTGDALNIYFLPYEIAPYVAGFPTFTIPYEEIMDIIDTNGDFWRSFSNTYGNDWCNRNVNYQYHGFYYDPYEYYRHFSSNLSFWQRIDLGKVWITEENGWHGEWRRREDSFVFDARWTKPGEADATAVLTMHPVLSFVPDNLVHIVRQHGSDGKYCEYTVRIDGTRATGTYRCNQEGDTLPWSATISY